MTRSHAVDLWLGELTRKRLSERTIDTYRRFLDKLCDQDGISDVDELTSTQIRRFLDDQARLAKGGRKSASTIAQNVTIINGWLDWLTAEGIIVRNPARRNGQRILSRPRQLAADENDNVTTISGAEVGRLLEAASKGTWNERLAVNALAYLGPRRHALAVARIGDYDQAERTLAFREKGGKTIAKPVPHVLADLIDAAIAAGVYTDQLREREEDYLIPGRAPQRRPGERDDRVIWHLVRSVALEAGVTTHVHALRAAFAVEYLETHPGQIESLQQLLGHKRIETTLVYLRRLQRRQQMETVRDMDWGHHSTSIAPHDNSRGNSEELFEAAAVAEKEGFEPSFEPLSLLPTASTEHEATAPGKPGKDATEGVNR